MRKSQECQAQGLHTFPSNAPTQTLSVCYNILLLFYNFLYILAGKKPQKKDSTLYSFWLFVERKTE